MKIFILEDCMERMKWFNKELVGCEITHSETAIQAIELLTANKYDRIFLDHDLGGEQMVDGELVENTGLAVAKVIPKTINKGTQTIIHSWNPVGATRMYDIISEGGNKSVFKSPFGTFRIT